MAAVNAWIWFVLTTVLPHSTIRAEGSYVIELNESFGEERKEGSWLVEFYAPWCGYCKRLEPIWEDVGKTLFGSSINVAKLDATRFSGLSKEYGVRGFPTIKLIKRERVITYMGDRTVQDIVQFAERASGPAVQELESPDLVRRVRKEKPVCFLLVISGLDDGLDSKVKDLYSKVAEKRITKSYFYSVDKKFLPEDIHVKAPSILVFKDDLYFSSEVTPDMTEKNISEWIESEQYPAFVQITRSILREISESGKALVFAVFAEDKGKATENSRFKKLMTSVAVHQRETFGRKFQFGWTLGDDITSDIVMSSLACPYLLVLNTTNSVYYLKQSAEVKDVFTQQELTSFLQEILEGRAQGYGGDSFFYRLYRAIWSFIGTVREIWTAQPIVASLIFGLPALLFSFLIYTLCSADPGEGYDEEFDEDEDEDYREDDERPGVDAASQEKPKTE